MQRLNLFLQKISTGWVTLAGFLIFLLFTALVLPGQSQKAESIAHGTGFPDTSFIYTTSDLYHMAEAYGEPGRKEYIKARFTIDLVFPIIYSFFLITVLSWVFKRGFPTSSRMEFANLLPLLGMSFDYLENISASIVMARYPDPSGVVAGLAPVFTLLKWLFIGLSFIILIYGVVMVLWSKVKKLKKR